MKSCTRSLAFIALSIVGCNVSVAAPLRSAVVSALEQCNGQNLSLLAPLSKDEKEQAITIPWRKAYSAGRQWQDAEAMLANPSRFPWADKAQTRQFSAAGKSQYEACLDTFQKAVALGANPAPALASSEAAAMGAHGYKILVSAGADPKTRDSSKNAPYGFLAIQTLAGFDFFSEQPSMARPATPQELQEALDVLLPLMDINAKDRLGRPLSFYAIGSNVKTTDAILRRLAASNVDLAVKWKSPLGGIENLTNYYQGSDSALLALMTGAKIKIENTPSPNFSSLAGEWNEYLKVRSFMGSSNIRLNGMISAAGKVKLVAANGVVSEGQAELLGPQQVVLRLRNHAPGTLRFSDGTTESPVDLVGTMSNDIIRGTFKGTTDSGEFALCKSNHSEDCSL